ncbi:hypothetical protein Peur_058112 [Populus x canadensis]
MHILSAVHTKFKHGKEVEKHKKLKAQDAEEKRALELGEEPPSRKIPCTIENTRENDETVCKPDDEKVLTHSSCSAIESTISTHGQK